MSYRKPPIKLGLVDDHKLFRQGLTTLIGLADKYNYLIVFEAGTGKEMIDKLDKKALPDIILMDIDMPDMDGFEAVAWLKKHYPTIAVLVVSMVDTEEALIRMLRQNVKGYLSKDIEVDDIHKALQAIMSKGYYYTDFITGKLIDFVQEDAIDNPENQSASRADPIWNKMNENERKFLTLACTEMTYDQIADEMILSPKTIDGYRSALFSRFKVKTRIGLAVFAIKNGLIKL